ncbi:hypothetical protein FDUTEX481_09137 [Tolypothrix sp. PCC 7601]|nr:hypothetical protein FDUTEX481_09137 [Tolypothrix sp. PCC 7601]
MENRSSYYLKYKYADNYGCKINQDFQQLNNLNFDTQSKRSLALL